jgi:hypothetical protein
VTYTNSAGREELNHWLSAPSTTTRGYRDDFFLKVMAAVQGGDPAMLAGLLSRQRTHLLKELRSLAEARALAGLSPVVTLLITAAELHARADLGVVDAAEKTLGHDVLAALRLGGRPAQSATSPATSTRSGTAPG